MNKNSRRTYTTCAVILTGLAITGCTEETPIGESGAVAEWSHWGNSEGGLRYSQLTQITPSNVHQLKVAWTYRTGDLPATKAAGVLEPFFFEATPIVNDGRMYLCTPTNRVVALDPEAGRELWSFDPKLDRKQVTTHFNCRGVTYYRDDRAVAGAACATRILTGTLDGRLMAIDAANGRPCAQFGEQGSVDLRTDLGEVRRGEHMVTSPPVVIADRVIVGGFIKDQSRIAVPAGVVRAYDIRTGTPVWAWNALAPGVADEDLAPQGEKYARGTPNAWGLFSVDRDRGLVFVPTGNTSGDYYGGDRNGLDYYGSSIVALDGVTGRVVWHFQTVHHDLWDFDVGAQPVLFDFPTADGPVPAVAQATKQGHIFILARDTGVPLVPVQERPVPQHGAVPGEKLAPTQPFPTNPTYALYPGDLSEENMWGFTPWDRAKCRALIRDKLNKGMYTPPSLQGSIFFPNGGGITNWGGLAIDPRRNVLVVNTTRVPIWVRLKPAKDTATEDISKARPATAEVQGELSGDARLGRYRDVEGSPYAVAGDRLLSPFGAPCNAPPWGTLTAIDLKAGKRLWEVPLGTTRDRAPFPIWLELGVPNVGGPIVTASGLAFIAATSDNFIRAFDVTSGEKLWQARLPAGGQAVPITYRLRPDGKQYVVIAAGGHQFFGSKLGDYVIAYALED